MFSFTAWTAIFLLSQQYETTSLKQGLKKEKSQDEVLLHIHFILKAIRRLLLQLLQKEVITKIMVVITHRILNCLLFGVGDYWFSNFSFEKEKSPTQLSKTDFSNKAFTGLSFDLEGQNIADSARQTARNPSWLLKGKVSIQLRILLPRKQSLFNRDQSNTRSLQHIFNAVSNIPKKYTSQEGHTHTHTHRDIHGYNFTD